MVSDMVSENTQVMLVVLSDYCASVSKSYMYIGSAVAQW